MIDALLNVLWLICLGCAFASGWHLGKAEVYREWRLSLEGEREARKGVACDD